MSPTRISASMIAGVLLSAAVASADTTLTKKPDLGTYWHPVGANGSYVYADSFVVPNGFTKIERLGTWLDDQGTGGTSVRLEVWGDNGGPDAFNVIATTGSVNPPTGGGLLYDEYGTSPGFVVPGQKYWFVITGVGEAGPGEWYTGGHTQNSGGIVDNGTFWYSNDPSGTNFDGQNLTPEVAFSVTLAPAGGSNNYYLRSEAGGPPWGVSTNEAAMTKVFGTDWADARFETVNVNKLFDNSTRFIYMDGSDQGADELASFVATNKAAMEAWVKGGGCLLINSAPNEGNGFAMGFGEKLNYSEYGSNLTLTDAFSPIALGPYTPAGSAFTGNSASHAYLTGTATPIALNEFGNATIAERTVGEGHVVFGALTTDNWWDPQPNAANFRANLIVHTCHVDPIPDGGFGVATDGHLYKIKLPFAAVFDVGDTGVGSMESIAERPVDGKLYGFDSGGNFYSINTSTGAATLKGNAGLGNIEGMDFDRSVLLACDFGVGRPSLYSISQSNGAATYLLTGNSEMSVVRAMAADGRGFVILCTGSDGSMYSMDLSNGYTRYIGTTGAFIASIDFGDSGLLYALDESGNVYGISLSDASAVYYGNTGGQFWLDLTAHVSAHAPGCYADCDGNGTLDLFDFLCFVNSFNAQQNYADCDGNGSLDLFDFLCFVNAFNAGC